MRRMIFISLVAFNVALLLACVGTYLVMEEWRASIILSFDESRPFVQVPPLFRYSEFVFIILNLPAAVLTASVMKAVDALLDIPAFARAMVVLVLALILSTGWAAIAARLVNRFIGARRANGG
jgi:hypothetical protein